MSSFKSTENIHKKEDGSYYVVSANNTSLIRFYSRQNNQLVMKTQSFTVTFYWSTMLPLCPVRCTTSLWSNHRFTQKCFCHSKFLQRVVTFTPITWSSKPLGMPLLGHLSDTRLAITAEGTHCWEFCTFWNGTKSDFWLFLKVDLHTKLRIFFGKQSLWRIVCTDNWRRHAPVTSAISKRTAK